jgi:phage-related protein
MPIDNVTVSVENVDLSVLDDVVYFVEATSLEQCFLWEENERRGLVEWDSKTIAGFFVQVGKLNFKKSKAPVVIQFTFVKLNGLLVAFYEATSMIVDHDMVRAWFKNRYPYMNHTDSTNFAHCLNFVRGVEVPAEPVTLYDHLKE